MTDRWSHSLYQLGFDKHVDTLTPSQQAFPLLLHEWILNPQHTFIVMAGGPGTGKTYTVSSCLNRVKIPQLRMAPSARVAHKMEGYTIHSALRLAWTTGSVLSTLQKELEMETDESVCLHKSSALMEEMDCKWNPQIVVIDEIGMVAYWFMYWIVQYFFQRAKKPILFVVMGDPNQLRPVRALHNVFSTGLQMDNCITHHIHLLESKRFTSDYEPIIVQLREFVDNHDETGLFTYLTTHFPVVDEINSDILMKCTRALAYLKATVESYNAFYLKRLLKGRPTLRLWQKATEPTTYVDVKEGCHIFLIQNGVSTAQNGTPLLFESYKADEDCIECLDPLKNTTVKVLRNLNGDFPIVVGFAGTIHKFQGDTMDDQAIAINFNGSRDLNLVYTALSRVKSMNQIVAIMF